MKWILFAGRADYWTLQWRYNERDGVSNHPCPEYLLNRSFRRRLKKTSKLRAIGLCEGNPPLTGGFPPQRPSHPEKGFHLMTSWSGRPAFVRINLVRFCLDVCGIRNICICQNEKLFKYHSYDTQNISWNEVVLYLLFCVWHQDVYTAVQIVVANPFFYIRAPQRM